VTPVLQSGAHGDNLHNVLAKTHIPYGCTRPKATTLMDVLLNYLRGIIGLCHVDRAELKRFMS
jgi:hypothetical protein